MIIKYGKFKGYKFEDTPVWYQDNYYLIHYIKKKPELKKNNITAAGQKILKKLKQFYISK